MFTVKYFTNYIHNYITKKPILLFIQIELNFLHSGLKPGRVTNRVIGSPPGWNRLLEYAGIGLNRLEHAGIGWYRLS